MDKILSVAIFTSLLCTLVFGCSIPVGGFVDPGIEGRVYYSTIVAVGTVTEITEDPSFWGGYDESTTYGARVVIWCSYKGGVLPRTIHIGEAGYIPGMCFPNHLELNEEYILFLHYIPGVDYFIQADSALPVSRLSEIATVCDLELDYPSGAGTGFAVCPAPTNAPDCLRYEEPSWQPDLEDSETEEEEE